MNFDLLSPDSAPEGAAERLAEIQGRMGGFLPNLYRQMAHAPVVLETYLALQDKLRSTSFSPAEQQLIMLTASAHNGCTYCVPAHSSGARMAGLDKAAITAIRDGTPIEDARLQALRAFVEAVIDSCGRVGPEVEAAFLDAGFARTQAAEALIGVAAKALSNSFAALCDTPVDEVLAKLAWQGKA